MEGQERMLRESAIKKLRGSVRVALGLHVVSCIHCMHGRVLTCAHCACGCLCVCVCGKQSSSNVWPARMDDSIPASALTFPYQLPWPAHRDRSASSAEGMHPATDRLDEWKKNAGRGEGGAAGRV